MSVLDKIKQVITEQLSVEESEVREDASLVDDLGADSLDITEILMVLEQEYKLDVSDEELLKLKTVGDIVKFIEDAEK